MTFTAAFIEEAVAVLQRVDQGEIEACAAGLAAVRQRGGRLFILGVGGSAGHASHAVNDFRKLCDFEAYAPTDNVSELTARINDEGWDTTFCRLAAGLPARERDGLSGLLGRGGTAPGRISTNLVAALGLARERGASIFGIVGRDGGSRPKSPTPPWSYPPLYPEHMTPLTEGLCAVVWHLLVTTRPWPAARRSGRPPGDGRRRPAEPGMYRRRGRVHRQPLRRPAPVADAGDRDGHGITTTSRRGGSGTSPTTPATIVCGSSSATPRTSRAWSPPCAGSEVGHPPGVEPGHRPGQHRPGHRLRRRGPCSPTTWSRPCACREPSAILYASGSGVYGDLGELEVHEDHGPLQPVSTYGASKLAGEALISSYCSMFGLSGCVFRFGNVVGPRQTHGVGFDFVRRLLGDPTRLPILGDGQQSKSYVHVVDVVAAVMLAAADRTPPTGHLQRGHR